MYHRSHSLSETYNINIKILNLNIIYFCMYLNKFINIKYLFRHSKFEDSDYTI